MVPRVVDTAFLQHPLNPLQYLLSAFDQKLPDRRKVGDTLIASVTPADETIVSYVWSVSEDGTTWSAVTSATTATFGVTSDYVGKYVKVEVIDDDARTAEAKTTAKVEEAAEFGVIEILDAEATAANEITVTLANAVVSTDTTISVTRGTNTVNIDKTSWADTFDSVVLTTAANMVKGTYTVTLTSTTDATNTDSDDFEVEDQKVMSIVMLNETALTNKDELDDNDATDTIHTEAYAYYDVLDQYGESIRTSASIQWSGSAVVKSDNKATGLLTLTKNDEKTWVYGEKIYLTGVYTKTGVVGTAELTIGTEQALNSIEVVGFVKKNTTKLEKTLPADFKSKDWLVLFNAYDQNDNPIAAGGIGDDDVNIISDNVLVVKEVKGVENTTFTIDGVEYNAIGVEPGIKVADGGKVTLTAIATRTGNKTTYECVVGVDKVITSFVIGSPAGVVADGDQAVKLSYTATTEDGESITDFLTIAKQETFNALSFNVGGNGTLYLKEEDDGSAGLYYNDEPIEWNNTSATDGIDRPVSLTAVVLGGSSDNQMLSISDKRRPAAIKDVNLKDVYVAGAEITLGMNKLSFYDQYGETIKGTDADKKWGDSTGFFDADAYGGSQDFVGKTFSVRATYTGNGKLWADAEGNTELGENAKSGWILNTTPLEDDIEFGDAADGETAYAATDVTNSATNEGFKFEIVKTKVANPAAGDFEVVSRAKTKTFTIVNIKKVKNFTVADLGTLYVGNGTVTANGKIKDGDAGLTILAQDEPTAFEFAADENLGQIGIGAADENDYQKAVVVKGTYNGTEVTVPVEYYTATGEKVTAGLDDDGGKVIINGLIPYESDDTLATYAPNGLTIQDLYDKTSARGVSKLGTDTIKATIYDVYGAVLDPTTEIEASHKVAKLLEASAMGDFTADTALANFRQSTADAEEYTAGLTYTAAIGKVDERLTELEGLDTTSDDSAYKTVGQGSNVDVRTKATAAKTAEINELTILLAELKKALLPEVVDTASTTVSLSDQAPKASSFKNFKDTYTFNPTLTEFGDQFGDDEDATRVTGNDFNDALSPANKVVAVLDQYGIDMGVGVDEIEKKINSLEESATGFVADNFTISGNNTTALSISGAERGDTFKFTISYKGVEATAAATIGADTWARVDQNLNWYTVDTNAIQGLKATLDTQRLAILGEGNG